MRRVAAVLLVLTLSLPAGAADAPSGAGEGANKDAGAPASPPPGAVIAFGVTHPDCQEWTDGCVICTRSADALNCSTPGIACQPGETVCKRPAQ